MRTPFSLTEDGELSEQEADTPLDNFYSRAVGKRVEILALPLGVELVGGSVDYARCEILDGGDGMVLIEQFGGERFKVEPLVCRTTKLSVIEIAAVDVNDCVFHSPLLKVQEPDLRPALRRLPESRRVKRPVIGGTRNYSKIQCVAQRGIPRIFDLSCCEEVAA